LGPRNFLPPVNGGTSGVTLLMLATSLADELKTVNDVGVKGETADDARFISFWKSNASVSLRSQGPQSLAGNHAAQLYAS
jgi:hypothetical protein